MADKPYRVQLKRIKGWKMPPATVIVARQGQRQAGTGWGNPFSWQDYPGDDPAEQKRLAKKDFAAWLDGKFPDDYPEQRQWVLDHEHELEGKNVACWCRLGEPCHADVYLERQEAQRCE